MSNTDHITVYVNEEERSRIQREADEAEMSMSAYIISALEDRWAREDTEATAERVEVEERVERIAAQATDEMEAMLEQMEQRNDQMADMVARSAVYSIANFESLKYQHKLPDEVKTNSIKIGARRLGDPLDLDADQDAATAESDLPDDPAPAKNEAADDSDAETAADETTDESSGGIKEGFFDRYA